MPHDSMPRNDGWNIASGQRNRSLPMVITYIRTIPQSSIAVVIRPSARKVTENYMTNNYHAGHYCKYKETRTKIMWQKAESLWQVRPTPRLYSTGGSIGLTVWLQLFWLGVYPLNLPSSTGTPSNNVSLDPTNVHAKWHLAESNGLSRGHECDRQTHYGEMCRSRQNHLRCKSDSAYVDY